MLLLDYYLSYYFDLPSYIVYRIGGISSAFYYQTIFGGEI
jgi:hypothetical protein